MKKILLIFFILTLTACSKKTTIKTPNEILLSIKDYSCEIQISYFSNKNTTTYIAKQNYSSLGKYEMEFIDKENLKITYDNSTLNISSSPLSSSIGINNFKELNQNPLFLSYFINTYFNLENQNNVKISENSISITMPNYNQYIHSAKLTFKNNLPHTLSYFDVNGNEKVNIIYNEFTFI